MVVVVVVVEVMVILIVKIKNMEVILWGSDFFFFFFFAFKSSLSKEIYFHILKISRDKVSVEFLFNYKKLYSHHLKTVSRDI